VSFDFQYVKIRIGAMENVFFLAPLLIYENAFNGAVNQGKVNGPVSSGQRPLKVIVFSRGNVGS